jgi:hypothetical protein
VSSELPRRYWPLCADFGPVDISVVHHFLLLMSKALGAAASSAGALVYCIEPDAAARANAAFLLAAHLVLCEGRTPAEAAAHFEGPVAPFNVVPFRDATFLPADYPLSLADCLGALQRVAGLGWFSIRSFDAKVQRGGVGIM